MNDKMAFISLWRLNDWGLYNRRDEAILWELSRRNNVRAVLHIEHIGFKGLIYKIIELLREKDKSIKKVYFYHIIKGLSFKPLAINDNKKYYIYSVVIIYSGKNVFFKRINDFLMKVQYKAINKLFNQSDLEIVLIAYPPSQYLTTAIKSIRHNLLIADFEDDTAERKTDINEKKQVLENYKEILPQCKWIFSTSPTINQKYSNYAGKAITYLPNGVDIHNFKINSRTKHLNLIKNKGKLIGYIGVLNKEIDIDLLECMLQSFRDANFVLIGPATNEMLMNINKFRQKHNNIYYLGKLNYKDIPAYISNFDVLINIKKNDYTTAGGESQKIYEYLLTGKPIVSTPVPPADNLRDSIYVATDKLQFVEKLKKALEENNLELRKKRIQIAMNNSWDKRIDVILNEVSKLLNYRI